MSEKSRTRITNKCRHAEKYIRGEMCHVIHYYPKAYKKYMKTMTPTKNYHASCSGMSAIYMD